MILSLLSLASLSRAAPPKDDPAPRERPVRYREREEIDFEGLAIEGELVKPQGILVGERPTPVFAPMIVLRRDWNLEMQISLDEIE